MMANRWTTEPQQNATPPPAKAPVMAADISGDGHQASRGLRWPPWRLVSAGRSLHLGRRGTIEGCFRPPTISCTRGCSRADASGPVARRLRRGAGPSARRSRSPVAPERIRLRQLARAVHARRAARVAAPRRRSARAPARRATATVNRRTTCVERPGSSFLVPCL